MSSHTPGPWLWEKVEQAGTVTEHTLNGPDVLCRYWYDNPPSADARLIAAAPDLLDDAKKLVNEVSGMMGAPELRQLIGNTNFAVLLQRWERMRETIAKVEARSE